MQRIYLSKEEKLVLRRLSVELPDKPDNMDKAVYFDTVESLTDKGLAASRLNYDDVLAVEITSKGKAYIIKNPHLLNPFNWTKLAAIAACVAAVAATAALFVGCSMINKQAYV